jgi:mannose-6-phosphate isomerase-like protein (cupin superfamily)
MNLTDEFNSIQSYWEPKIVGELNDDYVKCAKLKGAFVWHNHENEDELFLVIKGKLLIKMRDKDVLLKRGEFFIVPKGVEHCPVDQPEAHVLFVELKSTTKMGDQNS